MATEGQLKPVPVAGGYETTIAGLNPFSVVGIDVGGTKIGGGIATFEARGRFTEVVGYRMVPTCAKQGGDALLERVTQLAGELVEEARANERYPLAGIGVATAGRVSAADGSIAYANEILPGWTGQPVRATIEARFHLPCAVLNDVQAYAMGEIRHGAAAGVHTAIVVAAGTGLGGAVVVNGSVHMGAHGYAGELGHTLSPMAAGIRCNCGSMSHLESVASGSGIEQRYFDATGTRLSGAEISLRAQEGDRIALDVIRQAGRSLGESIGSWANILDPELVVISGSVCKAGKPWRDALEQGVAAQLPEQMQGLPIVEAILGNNAPIVGAAERLMDLLVL
jgi:glucokinase